jgi:NAD(P)-dependent dehydrogenase (short-subunit alcohol dehydrogenase family)
MKKIDILILGGSGILGKEVIKKLLENNLSVLNLDIKKIKISSNKYNFIKFNLMSNNLIKNVEKLFKIYSVPKIFIDCSYLHKNIVKKSSFKNLKKSDFDKILKDWLSSELIVSNYILNSMKRRKIKGSVILTSSIYGVVAQDPNVYKNTGINESIAYSVIKSSINSFVKNAAVKYGQFGIRVNSICPGGIINNQDSNFKNKIFIKNYKKKVPLKRFAKASEIANIYEFLALEKSSYITGINLIADGGYTIT